MKKSILSLVLLITMLVSIVAPMSVFAAPTDDLKTVLNANGLSGIIDGLDNIYPSDDDLDKLIVPANIELKQTTGGVYGDSDLLYIPAPSSDPATFPTFDFQTTLNMEPVRQAFRDYINGANIIINAAAESPAHKTALQTELSNMPISGKFTVVVEYTDGLVVPNSFITGTDMLGFKIKSGGTYTTYTETGNIYEEASRSLVDGTNWDQLTIEVNVKGPSSATLTAGDMMTANAVDETKLLQFFGDLALECTGVQPSALDTTYKVKGGVTGNTKIGGTADGNPTGDANMITNITYTANQEGAPNTPPSINEHQVSVYYTSGSSSSGGGSRFVVVKFDVDGDTNMIEALKLRVGTVVDFDAIETPTKEGYIFDGFYYDDKCTEKISGEVKITKNTVVFARWIKSGTVHLVVDVNGKTDVAGPFEFEAGEMVDFDSLSCPTMIGYVFDGYYLDKDFETKATGTMPITEDTILYGRWLKTEAPSVLNSEDHFAYIAGYPNYEIRPFDHISREEISTIFYRILKNDVRADLYTKDSDFTDVEQSRWSNDATATIANGKYVIGYEDGTFRPEDNITRAEFVTIVARFHDEVINKGTPFNDIGGHWAESYIITAATLGWIEGYGDGTFRPDEYITRADVIRIINRLLVRCVNEEGLHEDTLHWVDNFKDSKYYYDILEATNSHNYVRQSDDYTETWTEIVEDTFIIDQLYYE